MDEGLGNSHAEQLRELCAELLRGRRLVLASNRGPIQYRVGPEGRLEAKRGTGGVVTALSAVAAYVDLTWLACPMGEGDRKAAAAQNGKALRADLEGQSISVRFVPAPRRAYHKYYNVIANPLLWFLQHYMWDASRTPIITRETYDAWRTGYVPMNRAFADCVVEECRDSELAPLVMLHDYHLYLAAGYIRRQLPTAILHQFIHVPWPSTVYWQLLPAEMRLPIYRHMCANDIVGMQTMRGVRQFLQGCAVFLPEAEVDFERFTVWREGHLTRVRAYPISIDVGELRRLSESPRVRAYERRLKPLCAERTIVRVDRLEPSKNIVRGLMAYRTLLSRHREWLGRVTMLAFLVPTRTELEEYRRYTEETLSLITLINDEFGSVDWQPIHLFHEDNYLQAIAGMRLYDVLLVNPVVDGMNLVSKEGPIVNQRDGVMVLSEGAGSYEQLGEQVLAIAPADLEGTCQALLAGLNMAGEERQKMAGALRRLVEEEDLLAWLRHQFEDLAAVL